MALRPFHYIMLYGVMPLLYYVLRGYLYLLRIRVIGEETLLGCFADHGRIVVAVWHQRFLAALAYVTKFRHFKPIVMISQSRDGELAARVAQKLGLAPVRGSSSRGGTSALMAIREALRQHPVAVHIVDGPRGPKGVVKPGLLSISQMSGAVVVPLIISAKKAWVLGSWDRFIIPKPFSDVTIEWGQPFVVPRELDPDRFEEVRSKIEESLTQGYAEADRAAGWPQPL